MCGNYTWSSRNYMTDQLILSRDSPCSAVMPGTSVAAECDPEHSYNPSSGEPIYIGVYGYAAAQFTLLVAPEGQSIALFPGAHNAVLCSGLLSCTDSCFFTYTTVMHRPASAVPHLSGLCLQHPLALHRRLHDQRQQQQEGLLAL